MAESVYTYDSLEVAVDQLRFQYPKVSLVATADNPEYLIFFEADNAGAPMGPELARVVIHGN